MIEFKCLHLLNQKNIFLHLGIINSIKNYRINLKDGNYMILLREFKRMGITPMEHT
jgi:hypothetical protein